MIAKAHLRGGRTSNEVIALERGDRSWAPGRRQPWARHGAAHPDGQPVRGDRAPLPGPRPRATGAPQDSWPPARIVLSARTSPDDARKAGDLAASIGGLYGCRRPARLLPPRPARDPARRRRGRGPEPTWTCASATRSMLRRAGRRTGRASWAARPEIRLSDGYPANVLLEATHARRSPRSWPSAAGVVAGISPHQAGQRLDQGCNRRARTCSRLSAR